MSTTRSGPLARRLSTRDAVVVGLTAMIGAGVFAAVAIDFTESEVGPYLELVLAVIVPPIPQQEGQFPSAAFYPLVLATSTAASRAATRGSAKRAWFRGRPGPRRAR